MLVRKHRRIRFSQQRKESTAQSRTHEHKILMIETYAYGCYYYCAHNCCCYLQAEQLRRVLSETLHQTKNPLTALRTFGKLLLRRLPAADGANRELAEDIITQSDRLVDLLLPVDSIIGVLAATSSAAGAAGNGQLQQLQQQQLQQQQQQQLLQQSELAASAELQALLQDAAAGGGLGVYDTSTGETSSDSGSQYGSSQQHVHYAVTQHQLQLMFVQDAIEPIVRAAEAVAQAQRVSLRWRVDDDLPGVIGDERALQVSTACILTHIYI
jgi:hypothetical protein